MFGDDYLAGSVLYSVLRQKISVPDQFSIVSLTDTLLASMLPVALTTLHNLLNGKVFPFGLDMSLNVIFIEL